MIKHWLMWGLFAVLSVAALISSLGTAFQTLPLNPDMAEMALIYQGIVHHGWRFPFTWRFTQDNQILSLLPFALIFYALAGVSGASIIIQGWLIFVVNAVLTGLLVKVATKSWRWAGLAWLLALLASPMAIGQPTILAYPVTHNSVWVFGLLGAIGLIRYFTDRPGWALPLLLVCVGVGTISDPWFDAAFTAPVLLLAWKSPKWFQADKTTRRALIKAVIITYIAGRIVYFGLELLHMVPGRGVGFASLSAILRHLVLLAKSTGILLQLYPFPSSELTWMLWGVYLVGLCGAVILSFQARQQISPAVKVLLAFSWLSIGIIATAFVLTNFAHGIWASRFLVNVFYLAIVALVTFGAVRCFAGSNLTKLLLLITLIGYVMLGLAAIDHANWRYTSNWAGIHSLAKWFVTHNLYNGYGQYFEAGAPLLGIASNEGITARPLSCNTGYLIPRLSSGDDQFWFGAVALPSSQEPQFVVFDQADHKWARCTIKSFGNPDMKFKHGALDIWVYRHDLSQQLIMAHDDFKHKWMLMNIENNRKAITKVGTTLGISSWWAQNAYTWLLKKGIAQ
ncbi:hypothetical protein [Acidithiobacillus sulfurivorans]|uniref:Glycosyltransferase RgtA/B/C/D-like domain-containing protein n=1 Tax=Acidithiobacillus sulfurivorans TaxID=1958756 RepID=A0ABS5ZV88_9PROT|nr:hypothetical protein [Acidithiobacillus sulfurivorans]MBU2758836.1 hypothetical protein [Acidithiobacillus sulfurivorans]